MNRSGFEIDALQIDPTNFTLVPLAAAAAVVITRRSAIL